MPEDMESGRRYESRSTTPEPIQDPRVIAQLAQLGDNVREDRDIAQQAQKSRAAAPHTIVHALKAGEAFLGKDRRWNFPGDREGYLKNHYDQLAQEVGELEGQKNSQGESYLESEAGKGQEGQDRVNAFLKRKKVDIQLDSPVTPESVSMASVLDIPVSWEQEGKSTVINLRDQDGESLMKGGEQVQVPGVILKPEFDQESQTTKGSMEFYTASGHDHPIVAVPTKSGERVYMTRYDTGTMSRSMMMKLVSQWDKEKQAVPKYSYKQELHFPMVDFQDSGNMTEVLRAETRGTDGQEYEIIEAKYAHILKMDEKGALAKAGFAATAAPKRVSQSRPVVIDGPFLVWMEVQGKELFAAHIHQEHMKNPQREPEKQASEPLTIEQQVSDFESNNFKLSVTPIAQTLLRNQGLRLRDNDILLPDGTPLLGARHRDQLDFSSPINESLRENGGLKTQLALALKGALGLEDDDINSIASDITINSVSVVNWDRPEAQAYMPYAVALSIDQVSFQETPIPQDKLPPLRFVLVEGQSAEYFSTPEGTDLFGAEHRERRSLDEQGKAISEKLGEHWHYNESQHRFDLMQGSTPTEIGFRLQEGDFVPAGGKVPHIVKNLDIIFDDEKSAMSLHTLEHVAYKDLKNVATLLNHSDISPVIIDTNKPVLPLRLQVANDHYARLYLGKIEKIDPKNGSSQMFEDLESYLKTIKK